VTSEQIELRKFEGATKKRSEIPLTLDWKNAKMVRIHSVRAAVKEILNMSMSLDVVKVNIIGTPSTGKTTLAETISHLGHTLATIPYTIKKFTREDLLNFEQTLASLQPTNHILIFDDISFIAATAGKRQMDLIQKTFTEIRHLPGGQDVKIIAIFNFHYNMSVSKYLTQSDFFFYTSIGTSELDNTLGVVGKKYLQTIINFRKINQQALTTGKYTFELGKKGQRLTYKWRKPFAAVLFWNNISARFVVFPKREWIDEQCTKCADSSSTPIMDDLDIQALDDRLQESHNKWTVKQAMRIKLFNLGVYTYSKRVKQVMNLIDEEMSKRNCNLEQLATFYGLNDERTRKVKKLTP